MEPNPIPFAVIGEPLNKLLLATGHKLSREWPARYQNVLGGRELFVVHVRAARLTYISALYLGGDVPPDPLRLKEFSVALPLLTRAVLDSLLTILFILEDVPQRCAWFREADYKEAALELERLRAEYGGSSDPKWNLFLKDFAKVCEMSMSMAGLAPSQAARPSSLKSWPNPGSMVLHGVSPDAPLSPAKAFMKYLDDYFYIDLSQQTKLGGWGMVKRAGYLIDEIQSMPDVESTIDKYRHTQISEAFTLVLAIASEIEAHFDFGLKEQARNVWNLAAPVIAVTEEVYQKRYRELLR